MSRTFYLCKAIIILCVWAISLIAIKSNELSVVGYAITLFAIHCLINIYTEYWEESEDNE